MNIVPTGDRILIKLEEEGDQIKGGIYMPKSALKQKGGFAVATVVTLGSGQIEDGSFVKFEAAVGDRVLVNQFGITEAEVDGVKFALVRNSEIMAIIQ